MPNPGAPDRTKVLLDTVNACNKVCLQYNERNNNNYYTTAGASHRRQQEAYRLTLASRYDLEYRVMVQNYSTQHLSLVRFEPGAGLAQSFDQYGLEINCTKVAEPPDVYVALRSKQVAGMPGSDIRRAGTEAEQLMPYRTNLKVRYQAFNVAEVSDNMAVRYLGCVGRVGGLQVEVVILVVLRVRILVRRNGQFVLLYKLSVFNKPAGDGDSDVTLSVDGNGAFQMASYVRFQYPAYLIK